MTEQHPLTDKRLFIEFLSLGRDYYPDKRNGFSYDDMRALANWQLEQVIEWLRSADSRDYLWLWIDGDAEINKDELIADLRKAMRLQQQENN